MYSDSIIRAVSGLGFCGGALKFCSALTPERKNDVPPTLIKGILLGVGTLCYASAIFKLGQESFLKGRVRKTLFIGASAAAIIGEGICQKRPLDQRRSIRILTVSAEVMSLAGFAVVAFSTFNPSDASKKFAYRCSILTQLPSFGLILVNVIHRVACFPHPEEYPLREQGDDYHIPEDFVDSVVEILESPANKIPCLVGGIRSGKTAFIAHFAEKVNGGAVETYQGYKVRRCEAGKGYNFRDLEDNVILFVDGVTSSLQLEYVRFRIPRDRNIKIVITMRSEIKSLKTQVEVINMPEMSPVRRALFLNAFLDRKEVKRGADFADILCSCTPGGTAEKDIELFGRIESKARRKKISLKQALNRVLSRMARKHPLPSFVKELRGNEGGRSAFRGRAEIFNSMCKTLATNEKTNNVLLNGPSGAGKSELVQQLATVVGNDEIPELNGCRVFMVNVLDFKGQYTNTFYLNIQSFLKFLETQPLAIVFIDEIHQVVGLRGTRGESDLSELLLKPLEDRNIRFIGATTGQGMKQLKTNSPFLGRFSEIAVSEMSLELRAEIVQGSLEESGRTFPEGFASRVVECNQSMGLRSTREDKKTVQLIIAAMEENGKLDPEVFLRNLKVAGDATRQAKSVPNFVTELTARAEEGVYIEPEGVLENVQAVLNSNDESNNVILLGDAGSGKTAFVQHLARLIKGGQRPLFQGCKVFSTTATEMMADQTYVGQAEGRIKELMDFLEGQGEVILFIDEVHQLIGTGSHRRKPHDFASMLLTRITNPKIRLIGATTYVDAQHLKKNPAFESRFTQIKMPPMSDALRMRILEATLVSHQLPAELFEGTIFSRVSVRSLKKVAALVKSFQDQGLNETVALERAVALGLPATTAGFSGRVQEVPPDFLKELVGSDEENFIAPEGIVESMLTILNSSSEVNNAILLGESGSGKTALVQHLAYLIREGRIPLFQGVKVYATTATEMIAGQSHVGEAEGRIKELMDFLEAQGETILFIDEVHQLIGTGSHRGKPHDFAAMLLTRITNSKIRLIGATTYEDARHLQRNTAFQSRFSMIRMPAMTAGLKREILMATLERHQLPAELIENPALTEGSIRESIKAIGLIQSAQEVSGQPVADVLDFALGLGKSWNQVDLRRHAFATSA